LWLIQQQGRHGGRRPDPIRHENDELATQQEQARRTKERQMS
jgi:hypothetical protein